MPLSSSAGQVSENVSIPIRSLSSPSNLSFYFIFCVLTSTISTLNFGYHSAVINQPRSAMAGCSSISNDCIPMNDWLWGLFVSLFVVGGIAGSALGGRLASHLGRRGVLLWNNVGFILGCTLIMEANDVVSLCFGRFFIGMSAGVGTAVVPLYINELTQLQHRGSFGSLNQLSIVIGCFIAVLVGIPLSTRESWRWLFGIGLAPCLIQTVFLAFCSESPFWLASKNKHDQARACLQKLRGVDDVEEELEPIFEKLGVRFFNDAERVAQVSESTERTPLVPKKSRAELRSLKELFAAKELRRPLAISIGLQLAQQMSGINAAIYYSTSIFEKSYSSDTAIKLSLLVASINLVMTIVSSTMIERLGRRPLLLAAQFTMGVFAFAAAILPIFNAAPILIVGCLALFVAGFGLGLGSIPWLILPELVPSSAVGIASSVCASANWSANFIVAIVTPYLIQQLGYGVFYVFGTAAIGFAIFTYFLLPETKERAPEEI